MFSSLFDFFKFTQQRGAYSNGTASKTTESSTAEMKYSSCRKCALANQALVEVFRFLNRFDLDSAQTASKLLSEIVVKHGQTLSRRTIYLAQMERERPPLHFQPDQMTFDVRCQRVLHGRFLKPRFGPERLFDDDESLTACLAFLKSSHIRELRLYLQVDERVLSFMKRELVDVAIDQLIVRSAHNTSSTIRKLTANTFPGRLRSVSFEALPAPGAYCSSDLSSELVVLAAENGVDCFYTPRLLPLISSHTTSTSTLSWTFAYGGD